MINLKINRQSLSFEVKLEYMHNCKAYVRKE